MRELPRILDTRTVASGRIFRIEAVELAFSNGVETSFERIVGAGGTGAVLVVPVLHGSTLLLAREYAVGPERYELGFPRGRVEVGETIEAAASRELAEEIGYAPGAVRRLRSVTLAPGYTQLRTHICLATDLVPRRLAGDEPEEIEVVPWPVARAQELLARDDFTDARCLLALFLARDLLGADS